MTNVPVEELLDIRKTHFRFEIENKINNLKSDEDLESMAKKWTNNNLDALKIAKEIYGVNVSQEEVTKYIEGNVAPFHFKESEAYANALGLSLYELDFIFDRDIYVMDTLWNKLTPVLMEKHPQLDGENQNEIFGKDKKRIL